MSGEIQTVGNMDCFYRLGIDEDIHKKEYGNPVKVACCFQEDGVNCTAEAVINRDPVDGKFINTPIHGTCVLKTPTRRKWQTHSEIQAYPNHWVNKC